MALTQLLNAAMEAERDNFINTKAYERTDGRRDYRNGYYERDYTLNIGTIRLKVPRTRSGEFNTRVFEKYQRMDQALVLALVEMYVNGVSTRKVTNIVEELCGKEVSASFVSDKAKVLDEEVKEFRGRSLTHIKCKFLYVDALYIKVRINGSVVSKAAYIAQAVTEDNKRELVGFMIGSEESELNWSNFFENLRRRGLNTPEMIISDAHKGLVKAIRKTFLNLPWQRCTFHFIRNITNVLPKKDENLSEVKRLITNCLHAPTQQHARERKEKLEKLVGDNPKYEKALETLDNGFEDAIQYMKFPDELHVSLRTTNSLERINREIRRRDRVIGIYSNVESAERLIGSVLIDMSETFEVPGYRFFQKVKDLKFLN